MFADNLLNYFYEGLLSAHVKLVKVCCQPVKFVLCEGLLITCKISSMKVCCQPKVQLVKVCCSQLNSFSCEVAAILNRGQPCVSDLAALTMKVCCQPIS